MQALHRILGPAGRFGRFLLVVTAGQLLNGLPLAAQNACIQPGIGVFGTTPSPVWWGPAPSPRTPGIGVDPGLDDPRWNGAWSQSFASGTDENGSFRAVYHATGGKDTLYLSFTVNRDPRQNEVSGAIPVSNNELYIGLSDNAGTKSYVINLRLQAFSPPEDQVSPKPVNAILNPYTSNTGSTAAVAAPWLTTTALAWVYAPTGGTRYTYQLAVPIDATAVNGLPLDDPGPFKMWFQAFVPVPTPGGGFAKVPLFQSPSAAPAVSGVVTKVYPDRTIASNWVPTKLATGPADATCPAGISLSAYDIGTVVGGMPSSTISWSETTPRPTNTLYAKPLNSSGTTVPIGGMTARFRIANWGSQIGVGASWEDIPAANSVPNGSAIPNGPQPSSFFPITKQWQLQPGEALYEGLKAGTKSTDQCMLVELAGPGLTFTSNSARRNLWFVKASTVKKEAEINLAGLAPIGTGAKPRDVILHVRTINMLEKLDGSPIPTLDSVLTEINRQRDSAAQGQERDSTRGKPPTPLKPSFQPTEALFAMVPSYIVEVFHSTADSLTTDGVPRPIYEPQSSFAYLLEHDGPLYGWKHALQGATEYAPGWYHMAIAEGGKGKVTTTITGKESPREGGGLPWWFWIIILILLILLFLWLKKKL